jgi:hypothetical protein
MPSLFIVLYYSDIGELAMSSFKIPTTTETGSNPVVSCDDVKNKFEAEDLCLFGATQQAKTLRPPGFVRQSMLAG